MKLILLFALIILVIYCVGLPIQTSPTNLELTTFGDDDNASFELQWNPVPNVDEANPVIGYKVKVWEVQKIKSTKYVVKNGTIEKQEVEELPPLDKNKDPNNNVTVIDVPANTNQTVYNGVKIGVAYEVGVQAYTASEVLPFASKMRLIINDH